jgi:ABC-type antimicrobial peptide transport system permease subunit
VALTDIVPMRQSLDEVGYWTSDAQPATNEMPLALESIVTPDYLKVMGISLREGRFFTEEDRIGSNPVSVIDEVLARYAFKGQDPIGKRLSIQGVGPTQIIGVVGHIRHWGLANDDQAKVRAEVYQPLAFLPDRMTGFFSSFLSITVRTDVAPLNIAEVLQGKLRSVPGTPVMYDISTMEQLAGATLAKERFLVLLFSVFAGLALLLACVGIYGVMAYLTSQRIPEIGIRMALGASPGNILQLVLKQSLGMVLVGAGVGIVAALATGRLLLHLVDGMQATEPLTIAVMIVLLVAAALLASFVPALRASRLNAVQALRSE